MNAQQKDRELSQRIARAGAICSTSEARTLRRAAMTLHRWHELECGTDAGHIERDGDNGDGRPYFVPCGRWYGGRYIEPKRRPIPDRERGALARIAAKCAEMGLQYYIQGDPRGCALYVSPELSEACDYWGARCLYPSPGWRAPQHGTTMAGNESTFLPCWSPDDIRAHLRS